MAAGPLTCSRPATALSSQTSQRLAPRAPLPPVSQKGSGRRHGSSRWVVARWSCLLSLTLQHTELSSLLSPCAISYLPCSFLNPVGRASPAPLPSRTAGLRTRPGRTAGGWKSWHEPRPPHSRASALPRTPHRHCPQETYVVTKQEGAGDAANRSDSDTPVRGQRPLCPQESTGKRHTPEHGGK